MLRSVLPLLVCVGTVVLSLLQPDPPEDYKYGRQDEEPHHKFCSWKCLTFTLQWPGGFCVGLERWSHCRVPPNFHNWTIHGLWPFWVQNCCHCWPMFHSDIKDVDAELTEQWPSFLKTTSSFLFWKQEWEKHGVCAACVEGMNSPLRYFQICLKLRGRFDIHKLVHVADVHGVLAPLFGDKHEIQCVTDDRAREVWFQVKIPLSANLSLGCDHHHLQEDDRDPAAELSPGRSSSPGHPCPVEEPFYYFPIDHQQPHQPCG
ncbi:ribonuclease T2-like [Diretmus argenteus]